MMRKIIKRLFTLLCCVILTFMVGYWLFKYQIEDKDIAGINKLIVGNTWTRAGSKVGKAGIIAKAVIRK